MAKFNKGQIVYLPSEPNLLMTVEEIDPSVNGYEQKDKVKVVWFAQVTIGNQMKQGSCMSAIYHQDALVAYETPNQPDPSFAPGDVVCIASNPEIKMTVEVVNPIVNGIKTKGYVQTVWFGEETVKDAIFSPPPGFESSHLKRAVIAGSALTKLEK